MSHIFVQRSLQFCKKFATNQNKVIFFFNSDILFYRVFWRGSWPNWKTIKHFENTEFILAYFGEKIFKCKILCWHDWGGYECRVGCVIQKLIIFHRVGFLVRGCSHMISANPPSPLDQKKIRNLLTLISPLISKSHIYIYSAIFKNYSFFKAHFKKIWERGSIPQI